MITPPAFTACFYTVLFERPGAQELMKLMAPLNGKDIEQVLVTSLDIDSDVLATHELDEGVKKVMGGIDTEFDRELTFNPIYLPIDADDLAENLEVDKDGDITAIAGFGNPFISAQLKFSSFENPDAVDGKICFKQFVLPTFSEMMEQKQALS